MDDPIIKDIISAYNTGPGVVCIEKNRFGGCRKLKLVPKRCPIDTYGPLRCIPGEYINPTYVAKVSKRLDDLGLIE
jgi:hypothetical protein